MTRRSCHKGYGKGGGYSRGTGYNVGEGSGKS